MKEEIKDKEYKHVSVLLEESIDGLNLSQNKNIVDCTLGGAGHSTEILKKISPKGILIGFDLDPASIKNAKEKLKEYKKRVILINENFQNIKTEIDKLDKKIKINGILLDLGLSSYELSDETRGFSFQGEQPLNMSFSGKKEGDAEYIVNNYSINDLSKIIREYGEEKDAYYIAKEIVNYRKDKEIKTNKDLVYLICKAKRCLGYLENKDRWRYKTHPATQTFQALRIEVNEELDSLKKVLEYGIMVMEKGARMSVITFHSLEDRIVKNFFKRESIDCLCDSEIPMCICGHKKSIKIINKKPIIPSEKEIKNNARSRTAKLRVVEKI